MKPDLEAGYRRHCADFCRRMAEHYADAMKRAAEAGDVDAWTYAERECNTYLAELERLVLPENGLPENAKSDTAPPPDRLPENPPAATQTTDSLAETGADT